MNNIVNEYGGDVKVRSGGHCYENLVINDETKGMIDVRGLTDWGWDAENGCYLSSGDSNWGASQKLFTTWGKFFQVDHAIQLVSEDIFQVAAMVSCQGSTGQHLIL